MKHILILAAAGVMLAGPLIEASPAFAQQSNGGADTQRHGNTNWRDDRAGGKFDPAQHNGYYVGKTWHTGTPKASAYNQKGFQLGYKPWSKGQRLGEFNKRYQEVDYRSHNLTPPRRGYHYVQDDNGNIILAAIAGGLIASIIAGSN
jgi:Ni/Co efflux regulator RcnB